jgi:hypothetical protein
MTASKTELATHPEGRNLVDARSSSPRQSRVMATNYWRTPVPMG